MHTHACQSCARPPSPDRGWIWRSYDPNQTRPATNHKQHNVLNPAGLWDRDIAPSARNGYIAIWLHGYMSI